MADDKNPGATPDPRDVRILELEAQLAALKASADIEKAALTKEIKLLKKELAKTPEVGGDRVIFKGETHRIIGDFRADNTFADVKRGYCPEGVTLIAIDKQH